MTVILRISFASTLTTGQKTDAENILKATFADTVGTPHDYVQVTLSVVSTKRDIQDVLYEAVVTINGAAQTFVSVLVSLIFLVLFI